MVRSSLCATICGLTIYIIVNGAPVAFSEITEEHHELMTPDEYTAYFDILQERTAL